MPKTPARKAPYSVASAWSIITPRTPASITASVRPPEHLGHRAGVLRGLIQDPASELPRILIPRTSVNRGEKQDRSGPQGRARRVGMLDSLPARGKERRLSMSTMAYGAVTGRRKRSPSGKTKGTATDPKENWPPGLETWVDSFTALVPGEVLVLHGVALYLW